MIKVLFQAAAVATLATLPLSASALTMNYTVVASSTNDAGNQAHIFGVGYGLALPGGASWQPAPNTVTPPPANASNAFLSPWANTTFGDDLANSQVGAADRRYYSVQPNAQQGFPASANPAVLTFTAHTSVFNLLWGSIDSYNEITFINTATNAFKKITGADIAGILPTPTGCDTSPSNFKCVADITFSGDAFNRIEFKSDGQNAFEFATVPLPAAAWLLLGVSGALVAAKRRSARRAA